MQKLQHYFILLFSGFFLWSCGSDDTVSVNEIFPDEIETVFEVIYDADDDKTLARATFIVNAPFDTLDDRYIELDIFNTITFNGENLLWSTGGNGACYERRFDGFINFGEFYWTDTWGNGYSNTVEMYTCALPSFPLDLDASNFAFPWEGLPLTAQENMRLRFKKKNKNYTTNGIGDTSLVLEADVFRKIKQKSNKYGFFFLERTRNITLQDGTWSGGSITATYRSRCLEGTFNFVE